MRRASALAAAALLSCSVRSPATEVKDSLARAAPLEVRAGAATVALDRAAFADVVVAVEGRRARVLAMVDADGAVRLDGRAVALGYLGREAFEMEPCGGGRWCAAGGPVPSLAGVVEALLAAPRPAGRVPVAWQVRVERGRATVGEEAQDPGGARAPREVRGLVLTGGRWHIAPSP